MRSCRSEAKVETVRRIGVEIAVETGMSETVTVVVNELGILTEIPAATVTTSEIPTEILVVIVTEVAVTTDGLLRSHEIEIVIGSESVPRLKDG
jgi:hypothetical protein